ncbi:MAG: 4-alpha-glucanotransferase [Rikenellaceae bacterium]
MKVHFSIPFDSKFGQKLFITGSIPELSSYDTNKAIPLLFKDSQWNFDLEKECCENFEYSYILVNDNGDIEFESGPARKFIVSSLYDEYFIKDEWKSYSEESPFLSIAFKKVFYFNNVSAIDESGDITLRISANNIPFNGEVAVCGNNPFLGNWQPNLAKKMHLNSDGFWEITFKKTDLPKIIEYKFIQVINDDEVKIFWEQGNNRKLEISALRAGSSLVVNHFSINLAARKTKLAGTVVPVFSLRSEDSCGIGDFMDLEKMIDFLKMTRQNVLQLLPVNDTTMTHTWLDSYPYGTISIYALHPLYICPKAMGKINDESFLKSFSNKAIKLNKLEHIDYDAVEKLKWSYIKKIYEQDGKEIFSSSDYKSFFKQNQSWLEPYAVFCFLRDKYKTAEFDKWPKFSIYRKDEVKEMTDESSRMFHSVAIHYFVQYHLHKQLTSVHEYANTNKIILKGDIPIGVNRNSVEAWIEPHLFNFNGQTGAPPDDFSVKGQNWGFPTYDWTKMETDGYSWWKKRLRKMAEYFDAYRIDHILGFFRIWEIPCESIEGLMGHFNPALPFSVEEIRTSGYQFNYERDCKPYIKEWVLNEYFGVNKETIKNSFLNSVAWESFELKEEFNTQSKIAAYFTENPVSDLKIYKDELFSLCSEVLFLPDPVDPAKFHPRISAQSTKSYQALDSWQKERFNRIYDDYYYQRNNEFWYHNAMKKLPALISATGMLVCGEDLGMIPSCVPSAMRSLNIMSLEIQRMPKNPGEKFANPSWYPYLSVCTTGTHDTSTLRAWWKEDYGTSRQFFREILGEEGIAPIYCEPWLCRKIIESLLRSSSMLSIIPLQDWISISRRLRKENPDDERINIPSNPKHYWRYRFHINLENLINDQELVKNIRTMIQSTGRVLK